jgi:hypothetical protein
LPFGCGLTEEAPGDTRLAGIDGFVAGDADLLAVCVDIVIDGHAMVTAKVFRDSHNSKSNLLYLKQCEQFVISSKTNCKDLSPHLSGHLGC